MSSPTAISPDCFPNGRFAFLDLETTGTDPSRDRITEIGIVAVDDGVEQAHWSQLLDPGVPIPAAIQALTGITPAMIRDAPPFAAIAQALGERLEGRILVAHNARFDYGFLKAAYRRLGTRFKAEVLCTVRLSRRLYPDATGHGLDALVARHRLGDAERHRALGDARLIARFVAHACAQQGQAIVNDAVDELLRRSARPLHLPENTLEALPDGPGIYVFHGVSGQALYVGKAKDISARVRQHFYDDSRNPTDGRLASEVHRITFEETAGELTALIREIQQIRELDPLHNRMLRRQESTVFLRLQPDNRVTFVPLAEFDPDRTEDLYGPFGSRQGARTALASLGRLHRLCDQALGLWTGDRACFSRQIGRCPGLCCGEESPAGHHRRFADAIDSMRFPSWPGSGPITITETHPESGRSTSITADRWCAVDPARPLVLEFHPGMFKLLRRALASVPAKG